MDGWMDERSRSATTTCARAEAAAAAACLARGDEHRPIPSGALRRATRPGNETVRGRAEQTRKLIERDTGLGRCVYLKLET